MEEGFLPLLDRLQQFKIGKLGALRDITVVAPH
jgi:hypothetical protein